MCYPCLRTRTTHVPGLHIVYYLFFASPNEKGGKIVSEIFARFRDRGIP